MVSAALTTPLRDTLRAGLSVVTELWSDKAKDWVTSVHAVDINNDGELEIITCSRDGRIIMLNKDGERRWVRVIGGKAWVGTLAGIPFHADDDPPASDLAGTKRIPPISVIAGTRDGKVYAFDQHGQTIGKNGDLYPFDKDGIALKINEEKADCLLDTGNVIRQIFADHMPSSHIIIGSHDGHVYALNRSTRKVDWKFFAHGWVRAVFAGDINHDGKIEIIIGTNEKALYVLNERGKPLAETSMQYPIHAIYAADVDEDGKTEILVATDGKDLVVLASDLKKRWRCPFDNRLLSLHVADIDGDGHSEIIAGSEDKHLYILNGQGKPLWRHSLGCRVFSVYATDFNNDGIVEILAGAEDYKLHAYTVQLIRDLDKRILKHYRSLGATAQEVETSLPGDELALLQDILKEENKQHSALQHINLECAEQLIRQKQYPQALSQLLGLEQSKVQLLWRKGKKDKLGFIRSLCFGHMHNGKRTIIVGTIDGNIRVFNETGRSIGSINIGQRVLDVQTGFIERDKPEAIVVCSSDHQIYMVSGTTRQEKRRWPLAYETACIHVSNGNKQRPSEIFVGSEKQINIYSGDLHTLTSTITLPDGVRLVHAHAKTEEDKPEIVAGSANRSIHAFTRKGTHLWQYEVWDRVQAVELKDIDGDGAVEVIAGSEDRNIYVLDSTGYLRWRYILPHSVLTLQVIDVDLDGKVEILAGCANGYVYVFSKDGDPLWYYRSNDRIRALKVADLDNDGNLEIVVGSEDELDVLQVVNQQQVRDLIQQCLSAWEKETPCHEVNAQLLYATDPLLRAFAITRIARQADLSVESFAMLEHYTKDSAPLVRKSLFYAAITRYALNPQGASLLIDQLSTDTNNEVRLAFVEHISLLVKIDWQQNFKYLERLFGNSERIIRRAVVRQLDQLIDISRTRRNDKDIFDLLFKATQDQESIWLHQEAARVLAHLLDRYRNRLIFYMHHFIVRGLHPDIIEIIGHHSTTPFIQNSIRAVLPFLSDTQNVEVLCKLEEILDALKDMSSLEFGKDTQKIYEEFRHLFTLNTIEDLAYYRCQLSASDFTSANKLATIVLNILTRLKSISRYLNIYMKRSSVNDRLASLLDALKAVDEVSEFIAREYSVLVPQQQTTLLPDQRLFALLLKQWRTLIHTQLNDLRGKAHLDLTLQTKDVRTEEQVGIVLQISNIELGSASAIELTLLHSDDFEIVGSSSMKTEILLSQDTWHVEFTLKPHKACLELIFEVNYSDAESETKQRRFMERLELLQISQSQEFRYIPNPYSTGTPVQQPNMFYGRNEDVLALRNNLARASAQTVLLLYGQRRSGKTTLLLHLIRDSILEEHIPILIDMQRESYNICAGKFLHNIGFYITQKLLKRGYSVYLPEMADFANDPTFAFGIFLDDVETQLHGQKLILLIDEFEVLEEQIIKGRLQPEFLDYLRSMMQQHPSINFLLAGTHQIGQLEVANWSVFFNIARQYRLARLSVQGARDLITKPVENDLEYAPYTVEKIRELTADQPYLIHLLCRSLIDYCNERRKTYVAINDVNMVLREVMQTCDSHFDWLWKQLAAHEQLALAVIAELGKEEGRLLTSGEIEDMYRYHRLSYHREHMQACLKSLDEADIVESVSDNVPSNTFLGMRFRIPIGLLRMWLRREKPLRLLLSETRLTL
ncbi:MAG TPA: FG-GAP-like repeat-containing protein [Ktedonobacteraceae bacterium]|nr:FG-GAP-like repeat-containing protein [Ktedonobacteraceae bacterium]